MIPRTVLFTGGCRSGKSSLAQSFVENTGSRWAYVATARGFPIAHSYSDPELFDRILKHQAVRGDSWFTIEPDAVSPNAPLNAIAALQQAVDAKADAILFDCVTLWLSDQFMHNNAHDALLQQLDALTHYIAGMPVPLALVTDELGSGLVPETIYSRLFRDTVGMVNQQLGNACSAVVLAVCGQPLVIKGPGVSIPSWLSTQQTGE